LGGDTSSSANEETGDEFKKIFAGIGTKEEPLNDKGHIVATINSVQHNVPAWAIFGMFFIVIPFAGNMIRERDERSALRLELIPGVRREVALGKIFFYTLICSLQFLVMCCIGFWVLPMFDLPSLTLGAHPLSLIPVVVCIALSATAYGYFVGSIFKTATQATPFGAISVVILAAMGGIWVPVDLLPPTIQHIALLSPLHWGLDAVNQIILRGGSWLDLGLHFIVLITFSLTLFLISLSTNKNRQHSVQ
jgi:ABC-2 type transport system permease protein